jgi:hypothetical protein
MVEILGRDGFSRAIRATPQTFGESSILPAWGAELNYLASGPFGACRIGLISL